MPGPNRSRKIKDKKSSGCGLCKPHKHGKTNKRIKGHPRKEGKTGKGEA